MAADELNLNQAGTLPPELFAQQQALNRQQQLATALMQQNQQPQGQMISGRYVAPSFFQNLQPVANMLTGAYLAKKGDEQASKLAETLRQGREEERQAALKQIKSGNPIGALELPNVYGGAAPYQSALIKAAIPEQPTSVQEFEYANKNPNFVNYQLGLKRAGAANTVVNTGQHGFENTIKLGENFKSEPIYKTHQEINQAYKQINTSLDKANAAGDLAAAIKINKLLDPNSVVRESEVATVANATGLLPKLENYANKIATGASLNPQQRQEYRQLAKDFYKISGEQYNQTRNKYAQLGQQNGLTGTETILGQPWAAPTAPAIAPTKNMQDANKILGIPSINGNQ